MYNKTMSQNAAARQSELISRDPEIMGGMPVFAGTRVPASTLLAYMEKGHALNEFLDDFPTVTKEQAQRLLKALNGKVTEIAE